MSVKPHGTKKVTAPKTIGIQVRPSLLLPVIELTNFTAGLSLSLLEDFHPDHLAYR
jgi:hypothetical protein